MKQIIEIMDLIDHPEIDGEAVKEFLVPFGVENIDITRLEGDKGKTDVVKVLIPGKNGGESGGDAPTLGIVGQLGGIGARPEVLGLVSDADGAIVALADAMKLATSAKRGDVLEGDVIVTTHVAPDAPTLPHDPVPFMISPVPIMDVLSELVDDRMDAILSVDATKGNRVIKTEGFAITPTVKDGWILKVSDDIINIYERVTGKAAAVAPITMQDITPYGNDVYHINSIMQPWVMSSAPLVGVATTATLPVPGSGGGANYVNGLEGAARFCVEVARDYTSGICKFYREDELDILLNRYGEMASKLRKM
ncbi:DUF1177 domain-containing protein [Candidatus Thorarchaeota archaeon]|nr:MAG: DUF1177 domain-containing protein [Candidatus Thorarchaeota archaeon]